MKFFATFTQFSNPHLFSADEMLEALDSFRDQYMYSTDLDFKLQMLDESSLISQEFPSCFS